MAIEANFDGLVGPTHNYAGLSFGNIASQSNDGQTSNPRAAALQGLAKMRALMEMGVPQGVLAPQCRPDMHFLRAVGFSGSDRTIWMQTVATAPALARAALAASSMWTANAATVSPSADTADGRVHFSVANLSTMLHRSMEAPYTEHLLRRVFADTSKFSVHAALPAHAWFNDEGAANHMRLVSGAGVRGVEVFVYGRDAVEPPADGFPARQTREASQAIARRHGLDPAYTVFLRQSARAIAAGAFHNDVVAVSAEQCLFLHEAAFDSSDVALADLRARGAEIVTVMDSEVSLSDAITSYLFNAQLVRAANDTRLTLIAPTEAQDTPSTHAALQRIVESGGPIGAVRFFDLRESMRNGGGPACLRLRVVLSSAELAAIAPGFLLTPALADSLEAWVRAHYRDRLSPDDVRDPALIEETRTALDALTKILPLGSDFYDFQRH